MLSNLFLLSVVVVLVLGYHHDPCPRTRGLPDGLIQAENRYHGRALFRLDLRSAIRGYEPSRVYRLRVHTTSRKHKFNDASLVFETLNKECGVGRIIIDGDNLYSPKNCTNFVTTQQKQPMGRAHFKWEAPSCGCVHIRIQVHANSSYFIEDEYTQNGPLARTICPKPNTVTSTTEPTIPTSVAPVNVQTLSRVDKLHKLCEHIINNPMRTLIQRQRFVKDRKLNLNSDFEKERISIALEQRQIETETCCLEAGSISDCFGDVRRRRIDQFCGAGEPNVPFTMDRLDWIKEKESECCWQIGEDRYRCFNYTIERERMINDGRQGESQTFDKDFDEFDPANDIDDFDSEEEGDNENEDLDSESQEESAEADEDVDDKSREENKVEEDTPERVVDIPKAKVKSKQKNIKVQEDGKNREPAHGEKDDVQVKDNLRDKELTPEECCFNGITAGTKVVEQGIDGCFKMADMFHGIFKNWTRTCDRKFVVCCMRVVEGTETLSRLAQLSSMTKRSWISRFSNRR